VATVDPFVRPDQGGLVEALPQAALTVDRDGRVVAVNTRAAAVFDLPTDGNGVGGLLQDRLVGRSRPVLSDALESAVSGRGWSGQLLVRWGRDAQSVRAVQCSVQPVRDGQEVVGALLLASIPSDDAAEQLRLSDRFTRLARVASALVVADSIEAVTEIVIQHMADAAGATVASLSLVEGPGTLRLAGARGTRRGMVEDWRSYPIDARTPAGDVVLNNRIVVVEGSRELARRYPELDSDVPGDRSVVALPLRIGDRVLGCATMSYPRVRTVSPAEIEFLGVMSDTCAQAIERVRVTAQAADRSDRIRFLADSSVELSSSLDYEQTLAKVARLAVPWFADWCSISLDQDGELRTLAVAHVDPAKVSLAEELERRYPPHPGSHSGYRVFRSGRSELLMDIPDEAVEAVALDPDHLRLLRALDLRSLMLVPLKAQDRVLGVITWVTGSGDRRFGVDDLAFAEDLAHRAALAIDTARVQAELNEVATRLQRAVLPDELPSLPGWQAAVRYLQAGSSDAGGDFYDITPLADGRLAVFVGDVMGRGVAAAAAMAQMRAAIRALVTVDPDPRSVLLALDRLFEHYEFHQLVTLVYAVADPSRDELVVVNAGHPPPVVRRADGSVVVVEGEPGLLLGAGGGPRRPITVPLHPGDLFMGYTDGLVERRDEDITTGLGRLVDACLGGDEDLDRWLDEVVRSVRDTGRDDDMAVLALRRRG
jgi:GAF domain-containing protein